MDFGHFKLLRRLLCSCFEEHGRDHKNKTLEDKFVVGKTAYSGSD